MAATDLGGQIPPEGVLLAVGIPKGLVQPNVDDLEGEPTQWVRADGQSVALREEVFAVWARAMKPATPSELLAAGRDSGVSDASDLVAGLEEVGLLLRVDEATRGEALARVRVLPVALGLGNDRERRDVYLIGDLGLRSAVEVDPLSFGLWDEFDGRTSIGDACRAVAQRSGVGEEVVFSRVPMLLVGLMRARYVFIDRAVDHAALRA
jgi:hypothetical protein